MIQPYASKLILCLNKCILFLRLYDIYIAKDFVPVKNDAQTFQGTFLNTIQLRRMAGNMKTS